MYYGQQLPDRQRTIGILAHIAVSLRKDCKRRIAQVEKNAATEVANLLDPVSAGLLQPGSTAKVDTPTLPLIARVQTIKNTASRRFEHPFASSCLDNRGPPQSELTECPADHLVQLIRERKIPGGVVDDQALCLSWSSGSF